MANKKTIIRTGIISLWLFVLLEITTDLWFGSQFPGYNWKTQSLSYLGQSGSPVEHWVTLWGFGFSILILWFDYAFYLTYKQLRWIKIAAFALLLFGLGEGIGSGCFPINPPGTPPTINSQLHNLFSGIGDTGIVLFPFLLMFIFPRHEHRKWHIYLWIVVLIGLVMASFFLTAKYLHPDNFILHFKGIWQRIYTFNYYAMLLALSVKMMKGLS